MAHFVLSALATEITPDIAGHLRPDAQGHRAIRRRGAGTGIDPDELRDRGLAGAESLVEAVDIVAGRAAGTA
ncbi:hypothetical protein [Micromonospora sp. NPDC000668]|uniref:hypothetical protein n=1 Tax=Micromonospora sp. NPDC000668 TaxID=3364219 RepID=UPI00367CEB1F